jgi:hypothetical protein
MESKDLTVIILTTKRPSVGYEYAKRLFQFIPKAYILCDGVAENNMHTLGSNLGAAIATFAALKWAYTHTRTSYILFLEDDVIPTSFAFESISSLIIPPRSVVSLCDMRELPEGSEYGLYQRNPLGASGKGWWGNQAMLMDRQACRRLINQDWFSLPFESFPGVIAHCVMWGDNGKNCSDIRMGLASSIEHIRYFVKVPSLFIHDGHDSICFPGNPIAERATRNIGY